MYSHIHIRVHVKSKLWDFLFSSFPHLNTTSYASGGCFSAWFEACTKSFAGATAIIHVVELFYQY